MITRLSRRSFIWGGLTLAASPRLVAAQQSPYSNEADPFQGVPLEQPAGAPDPGGSVIVEEEQYYDPALLPPPESEIDFPIEPVNPRSVRKQFRRQMVDFEGTEDPGTLVVDPDNRFLYHVLAYGRARRYGVGVGRAGFAWAGAAKIGMKRRWPRWVPPKEMVDRDERAREWKNGQPGGPDNPLGARALYLYANGADTLYRIHGTNEPKTIGKAMSSGCIRMLNEDVAELFDNVIVGTPVTVRPSKGS
ncbi:L,D-transpeptidase [Aestuariivirga sp.]|uniref:L,D-transpeptidase n=1 Tax=Aestuariivirga sp. TaxID=2650926 RepID=UPI00359432BA